MRSLAIWACLALCICATGCASRGNDILVQPVRSVPMLQPVYMSDGAKLWVEVADTTGGNLRGLLVAFLQSEKNMRLADSERDAECIIRIQVREMGQTDSRNLGPSFEAGARGAAWGLLTGATLGLAIGSRSGGGWGAGIGALLGLSLGLASSADESSAVWALRAGLVLERQRKGQRTLAYNGEMLAVTEGLHMEHARAQHALETLLARDIVNALLPEGS